MRTYQNIVATSIPNPMQSTKTTNKRNFMNCRNPRPKTMANPIDEMQSQQARRTKNAGSSLANCDLVSEIEIVMLTKTSTFSIKLIL